MTHFFSSKTRQELILAETFTEHTPYTILQQVNSESGRVVVALSSENLLLNAYRQSATGLPSLLCMDASHKLVLGRNSFFFSDYSLFCTLQISVMSGVCVMY